MKHVSAAAAALFLMAASPAPFMPGVVSTEANEYNLSASDDGRTMVFARSGAQFAGARIMVMQKVRGRWAAPEPIAFTDGRYRDSDPWLTPDGRWLYFVSNRPAPGRVADRRDLDIWRASRTANGGWSAPEHLASVSSPGEELGPELHGGTLYFNSSRAGGLGNLDIYAAAARTDGTFDAPTALPAPINSAKAEGDFTLSRDGSRAFFWSSRGGKGELYSARRTETGWDVPVPLAADVNDGPFTFTPSVDAARRTLSYASTREREGQDSGMADIYLTTVPK